MHLTGFQFAAVFVVFLAVLLAVGLLSRGTISLRAPRRDDDPPLVDEVGPYEVPDDSSPTRSDD